MASLYWAVPGRKAEIGETNFRRIVVRPENIVRKSLQEILHVTDKHEVRPWLAEASLEELQQYLRSVSASSNLFEYARIEFEARLAEAARKPHWTTVPNFWLTLVAALAAVLGVIVAMWVAWLQFHPASVSP